MSGVGVCGPFMFQAYRRRICVDFWNSRLPSGRKDSVPEVPDVWLRQSCGTASSMVSNHSSSPWQPLTSVARMASATSGMTSLDSHLLMAVKLFFSSSDGG
ncbi:hypothetical protein D3C78_1426750 [compost metagenome]